MICPDCGSKMHTTETRLRADGTMRRRRVCAVCGERMSTLEAPTSKVIVRSSYKTRIVERLVHHLGYKSDLTGETYKTKKEALDATVMELNNILTQEDNNESHEL